jgi:hypothetical protein
VEAERRGEGAGQLRCLVGWLVATPRPAAAAWLWLMVFLGRVLTWLCLREARLFFALGAEQQPRCLLPEQGEGGVLCTTARSSPAEQS